MKTLTPEKMQRMAEFVAVSAEEINIAKRVLGEEFTKTPEGLEAAFLSSIVGHYLDNLPNFLVHFISGEPDKRGVDELVRGLRHKESKVKTDEKFIDEIEKLAGKVKKENLPDFKEWQYFEAMLHTVKSLGFEPDLSKFKFTLDGICVSVQQNYPNTTVWKAISDKSLKTTPRKIALDNYRVVEKMWKYIYAKLCLPPPNIEGIDKFEQEIASKKGVNARQFAELVGLPRSTEDEKGWTNFNALQASLDSKKKGHLLIRIFAQLGEKDRAMDILLETLHKKGKEGGREGILNAIKIRIQELGSEGELKKVEFAARDELAGLIDKMLADMRKGIETERNAFSDFLTKRIHELQKTHAKTLEKASRMKDDVDAKMTNILATFTSIENSAGIFASLQQEKLVNDEAFADVSAIISADTACSELLNGKIDEAAFDKEIDRIVSTRIGSRVSRTISDMKDVMSGVKAGKLPLEKAKEWIDNVFKSAMSTLKKITFKRGQINASLVKEEQELNRKAELASMALSSADETLTHDMHDIGRMGLDTRRIEEELPPEERRIVGRFD